MLSSYLVTVAGTQRHHAHAFPGGCWGYLARQEGLDQGGASGAGSGGDRGCRRGLALFAAGQRLAQVGVRQHLHQTTYRQNTPFPEHILCLINLYFQSRREKKKKKKHIIRRIFFHFFSNSD